MYADRIGKLCCSMDHQRDYNQLRGLTSINFPILKHYTLVAQAGHTSMPSIPLLGGSCPALISISVEGVPSYTPLKNLPSVRAMRISRNDVLSLEDIIGLRDMLTGTSVTHFELTIKGAEVIWPSNMTLELPALQILCLHSYGDDVGLQASGFVGSVYAPHLHTLVLRGDIYSDYDDILSLIAQMSDLPRKFPALRSLEYPRFIRDPIEIARRVSRALPDITHLIHTEEDSLIDLLQENGDGGVLWPHLRILSMKWNLHDDYYPFAKIIQLLAFRKSIGHPIETIRVRDMRIQRYILQLGALVHIELLHGLFGLALST
ncbi:hypothetical protein HWV62_28521 [Athelia sp. TMB]|nr:hypothetical protein HWV62_28521 [Athelia sp. TMB]